MEMLAEPTRKGPSSRRTHIFVFVILGPGSRSTKILLYLLDVLGSIYGLAILPSHLAGIQK